VQIIFAYSIPRKQGIEGGIVQKVVKRRLLPLHFHVAKAPAFPGMLPTSRIETFGRQNLGNIVPPVLRD
jgi:hypothetical protein